MEAVSMNSILLFVKDEWVLFLALVVIIALLIRSYRLPALVPPLTVQEAIHSMNKDDALMLDVRANEEYQQGHIQNSMHIPLPVLDSRCAELNDYRNHPIIVYCRAGNRSTQAGAILKKRGFSDIKQLRGGILDWQSANLPLSKKSGTPPQPKKKLPPSDNSGAESSGATGAGESAEQSNSGDAAT